MAAACKELYIRICMCFVGYMSLVYVSQIPNNIRKARNNPEHRKVLEEFWKVRVFGCVLYILICMYVHLPVCVCVCVCVRVLI